MNHALAVGGISYQKQVVELLLGTDVDHYGLINFTGTITLVESVGGVTLDNPEAFTVGDETFAEGQLSLDGEQALTYARYRGGADGDFGRINRQQQIIQAIVSQASSMDIVRNALPMLNLVGDHTRTDLTVDELLQLAGQYRSTCTESTFEMQHLSGSVQTLPDPLLEMDLSYVIVDEEEVQRQIEWLTGE